MRTRSLSMALACLSVAALLAAGCTSDDPSAGDTGLDDAGSAAAPGSEERCEANRAAGTITYLSGFDFAASAGILDVIVAADNGYFEELCLDVEVVPSASPTNLGLLATGEAQFANAGSFGDIVTTNVNGGADLVAIGHYGKEAIQALVVPDGSDVQTLDQLAGTLMGIKGDLPPDIEVMLARAGVERGSFDEVLLETFDPVAGFDLGIDSLPVYKSNEPGQLDAAGFAYRMFDPAENDVVSSFGMLTTTQTFLNEHPTAVEDFLRAAFRGFEFASANPDEAVGLAITRIDAAGNPFFLFLESESPRWTIESALVAETTPEGQGVGIPDLELLGAEVDQLTEIGRFDELPDWQSMVSADAASGVYDGATLIWPE